MGGPPLETAKEAQSDISVDDSGNLAWGAEEPAMPAKEPTQAPAEDIASDTGKVVQDYTITVDSTKKTFSSFLTICASSRKTLFSSFLKICASSRKNSRSSFLKQFARRHGKN